MQKFDNSPLYLDTPHIRMSNGHYIDVFDPECIFDMQDIYKALCHIPRFMGRGTIVMSVAWHSAYCVWEYMVEVADVSKLQELSEHQLALAHTILLHDAAEAFIGDIPSPIKKRIEGVEAVEKMILDKILTQWGLSTLLPDQVKEIDRAALEFEWEHFVTVEGTHGDETPMKIVGECHLGMITKNEPFWDIHQEICNLRGLDSRFGNKYQNVVNII